MENFLIDLLTPYSLWIKAFHIIAVIAWMAGLFYLPRLFVYHVNSKNAGTYPHIHETFKTMERKLYKIIMQPAMHLSLLLGVILAIIQDTWVFPWFHLKLTAVIFLVFFHLFLNYCRKELENEKSNRTERFFRIINEVPTLLLIVIVIAAVVKPFS